MSETSPSQTAGSDTSPPFRYRVSGMDSARDAADIERAAQSAGGYSY